MGIKERQKRASRMSAPNRRVHLSEEEIRDIYAQGEGAVVNLGSVIN